jgi:hypothetical protein
MGHGDRDRLTTRSGRSGSSRWHVGSWASSRSSFLVLAMRTSSQIQSMQLSLRTLVLRAFDAALVAPNARTPRFRTIQGSTLYPHHLRGLFSSIAALTGPMRILVSDALNQPRQVARDQMVSAPSS